MAVGTCPLFWRQLGLEDKAVEMETMLAQPQRAPSQRALATRQQPTTYIIDEILDERPSSGAAKTWYLVRWQGYDPSWESWRITGEVGSPVETWEPLCHVRRTEAFLRWTAESQEQES